MRDTGEIENLTDHEINEIVHGLGGHVETGIGGADDDASLAQCKHVS